MLPSPQNQRLYTFRSSIHRARVRIVKEEGSLQSDVSSNGSVTFFLDDENKKRPSDKGEAFVEYEISCHLVIHFRGGGASYRIGGKGEQQTWNVWKVSKHLQRNFANFFFDTTGEVFARVFFITG